MLIELINTCMVSAKDIMLWNWWLDQVVSASPFSPKVGKR